MNSPGTDESGSWSDSSSSVSSFGSSRLDTVFEYDEVDEDDFVDKWYGETDLNSRPIYTVGHVNYGWVYKKMFTMLHVICWTAILL